MSVKACCKLRSLFEMSSSRFIRTSFVVNTCNSSFVKNKRILEMTLPDGPSFRPSVRLSICLFVYLPRLSFQALAAINFPLRGLGFLSKSSDMM